MKEKAVAKNATVAQFTAKGYRVDALPLFLQDSSTEVQELAQLRGLG